MPPRILIVDDDLATREGLALIISAAGYHTLTVGNVPAAQDLIAAAPPDLLIADVRVGLSNGLQLIAMAAAPLPAIVITGFPDPSVEADARALGADFMLKPISPAILLARISDKLAEVGYREFTMCRRWVRRRLVRPVPLRVDHYRGRIVEVSESGVGLQIEWGNQADLPPSLELDLDAAPGAVPVKIAWARQQDDNTWVCGGVIADDALSRWRGLVETFA
jgi:CheY-like chemotaxis protein